jgi:hypothetical protein
MTLSFQHPHPAFVDEFTKPALAPMEEAFRVFQVRRLSPFCPLVCSEGATGVL